MFELRNAGIVDATGVTGYLTINANPYVAVHDGMARFPDIAAGFTGRNLADPFVLARVAPGAARFQLHHGP